MERPSEELRVLRFGPFEVNFTTGELCKHGIRLKLQDQPFHVLKMLLARPGELITRKEIRQALWPSGTFVDFDNGLNAAINRLREALGDSAEHPRFIETLHRRGYRFIGALKRDSELGRVGEVQDAAGPGRVEHAAYAIQNAPILRGSKHLKLVLRIVWLALVIATGGLLIWKIGPQTRSVGMIRSIAVLPLENLSGDKAQDYFADGMTEELITSLGQIGSVRVISRTSTMQYKSVHKPLPQIASELSVDAVVVGAVLRSGDQVRITVQLIQANTDLHLWAGNYQGDIHDVLRLQNQVATAIADEIRIKLTSQQQAALKSSRTVRPEAYEAYLQALAQSRTVDGLQKRISYLEGSLANEPSYPEAHAGLGEAYMRLGHMLALPPQEAFPRAKREARSAIRLDDSLADAHVLLATVQFLYDWDFPGAEKEFKRAIALNPNSTSAHAGYADFLMAMGRPDAAIEERVTNRQIDPLSVDVGGEQYWAGRYDLAIENARKVLAIDPNHYRAHLFLGLSLEQKHLFPDAIVELQKAVDLSNDKMWIGFVAHAEALAGDKASARKILAELEARSHRTYVSPWWPALIYPDLGDKEQAFLWLERCYQGREHDLVFSKVWPMFNSLHSDPRYQDLMKRVGLPD